MSPKAGAQADEAILQSNIEHEVRQRLSIQIDHSDISHIMAQTERERERDAEAESKQEILADEPKDDAEELGRSRNRKLDKILRGSKSNLDYTKKVLGMVETDRNTPRVSTPTQPAQSAQ